MRLDQKGIARGSVELSAGQHLKIETSPGGEELLDVVVPAGKVWSVVINVETLEGDAPPA